eukprot:CAMPEP_0198144326 /NCGR_PEP_ID=MMETSP1443-20131203/14541_1 /TAXON_ID=186043 /ORGANISM="Entomoneis sp., Strain CCMP2396" /LENGTH=82 /DNA_ID=CAMNT_0043807697 /DNA_START=68 /DNA_END=316 /DNA_ORIENTATION=-
MAEENNQALEASSSSGSWLPFVVLIVLLILRWLAYGEGNIPVKVRRWYKMQFRKRLGYSRDESVYKSGAAGNGASRSVKRQG